MEVNPNLSEKAQLDYKLVRSAIDKGDQQAYAKLMNRYWESIYYMLLKMVNNAEDANDLTIEAFGKAFKNLKLYTPEYAFSTWLFKIATNNCIDFIRKKKYRASTYSSDRGADKDDILESIPSKYLDPEEKAIKAQKSEIIREVVQRLNPRYKRLIELRYFKEYSYEEIATELTLPLGTVKAQLFRARELLHNIMKHSKGKI
ncbi:sigma-70 family RNA polymerase sigma factor [bacterium AH-315-C07]|nr:sigma-70 family RNA polymerase sigma factor [bacterium AH-315-C07]